MAAKPPPQRWLATKSATERERVVWLVDVWRNLKEAGDNASDWITNRAALLEHLLNTSAHGATGDIVGTGDTASAATRGPVYQAAVSADASASTVSGTTSSVSVTSADATDLASVITLANELKADVNTLVSDVNTLAGDLDSAITDLNAAITALNDLKAKMRTAEQLDT